MVSERFLVLSAAIQPTPAGIAKAQSHISTIKSRLKTSFGVNRLVPIGSVSRNTSIRGWSDVDLLAVFSRSDARWGKDYVNSDTFVKRIRQDLEDRFHATTIRKDSQAIVLHFAKGEEPVDVVPAYFHEFRSGGTAPIYKIPDGSGGWLETAPQAHGKYLADANTRSGGKLRKTVQIIKYWKTCRTPTVHLSSIYLELFLASRAICTGMKGYSRCLYEAFDALSKHECRGIEDPVGVAGTLYAVQTTAQWEALKSSLNYAKDHAGRALVAEANRNHAEAVRQWGIVFNGSFPA